MKTSSIYFAMLLASIFIYSCSDDDPIVPTPDPMGQTGDPDPEPEPEPEPDPDPAVLLAAERTTTVTTLTADSEKIWRISNAILNNSNGSFDISNEFNIIDDEFIFKNTKLSTGKNTEFEGTLEFRPAFDFNIFGATIEESLTESYLPTLFTSFDFSAESSTQLESLIDGGNLVITIDGETTTAIWNFDAATNIALDLAPKLASDYKQVPTSALQFTEAFTFDSNGVAGFAPGMTASLAANTFYFGTRENVNNVNGERIIGFNLDSGNTIEYFFETFDFVSKQLHIIDDELYVIGGQRINSYDLELSNTPISSSDYGPALGIDYLGLSRFGTAVLDGSIYIIGGDLDNNLTDKILVFDVETQMLSEFATMPEPRSGARAEIVNNKLYVFGGTTTFNTPPAKNTIYIYDLVTGDLTTETLPTPINFTYTGKTENLIYVGGSVYTYDNMSVLTDANPYMGVYDTRTGIFTELETDLSSAEFETIHSMAVFNSKIYVIHGQREETAEGVLQTWSILEAGI